MSRLDQFIYTAQQMGALYGWAPETATDPLTNLGSVQGVPNATLKGDARLIVPGLINGGAAVSLDGSGDYIDSGVATLTNLITNPIFRTGVAGYSTAGSGVTLSAESGPPARAKVVTDGRSSYQGIQLSPDVTIEPGETYTQIVVVSGPGTSGRRMSLLLWNTDGTIGNTELDFDLAGATRPVLAAVERTMPRDATKADTRISTSSVLTALTFRVFYNGLIKGSIAGLTAQFGSLANAVFPMGDDLVATLEGMGGDGSGRLSTGLCGWSGTADASASDRGPFARGTARTFVGLYQRASDNTDDAFFGGSGSGSTELFYVDSNENILFDIADTETWAGAGAKAGITQMVALVVDDLGDTAALYIDGRLISQQAHTGQFTGQGAGNLILGARLSGTTPFHGSLLPFAIYGRALSSLEIGHLYRDALKPARVAVTREYPPDKLAVSVTSPDGVPYRWAEDEPNAENVISNLRLVDEIPGGDKEAGGTLARDPRHDWRDQQGFGEFKVYGPGGEVVWGPGRLGKVGKNRGEGLTTEPLAVGYQAALDDNRALIGPGFIDRDLGKWTGPGAQRRINLGTSNPNQNDPQAIFDNATPALRLAVNDAWVSPVTPRCEAWFDAGSGIRIGRVIADWSGDSNTAFILERYAVTDDVASSPEGSADIYTAATGRDDFSPTTPTRFLLYGWRFNATPAGTAGREFFVGLTNLTILANHGLTPQGTWPDIGFTAAQMLEYAIPLYTDLELGEIEDDGFVIPQAWFSDPGPMSQVVAELTRYGLYDWLVFGRTFSLRAPGTYGRTWLARASECGFTEEGEDTERLWESIVVSYTDVDGSTRTVGPPGSGATVEDESLQIDDPDHPAVKAGVTRRDVLQMSGSATSGLAIAVGQRWLDEANQLSRSGQAKLSGYVQDDKGVMRPASQVRGGDLVRFIDLPDSSPRRVMQRNYEHDERAAAVALDAPSDGLKALVERLGVRLARLGG